MPGKADGKSDGKIPVDRFYDILESDPTWKVTHNGNKIVIWKFFIGLKKDERGERYGE